MPAATGLCCTQGWGQGSERRARSPRALPAARGPGRCSWDGAAGASSASPSCRGSPGPGRAPSGSCLCSAQNGDEASTLLEIVLFNIGNWEVY